MSTSTILLTLTSFCLSGAYDFFDNYVEVPTPPPESVGAIPKCGEGVQKGRYLCVPYYNCDPLTNTVVDYPEVDGSAIKEPRSRSDPRCGHYLEVCCQLSRPTTVNVEHAPTVNFDFKPTCGVSDETDWMVGLFNTSDSTNRPFCGGSLLSPVVVLTAAHCVERFQPNQIKVAVGEQEKNVSEVIIHEHYLSSALYNDVAILILNSSLVGTNNIGTICVPKTLDDINQEDCMVSGSDNVFPEKLKRVAKVPNKVCQDVLRKKVGGQFLLQHSFMCAGTKTGDDVCVVLFRVFGYYFFNLVTFREMVVARWFVPITLNGISRLVLFLGELIVVVPLQLFTLMWYNSENGLNTS